jgi:hypothetical protein
MADHATDGGATHRPGGTSAGQRRAAYATNRSACGRVSLLRRHPRATAERSRQ